MKRIAIYLTIALFLAATGTQSIAEGKDKEKTSTPVATASISGQVIDDETGEVLTGVLVKINSTGQETYTDFNGYFNFENVQPGAYEVVTKLISYQVHVDKNIKVEKAAKKSVKVKMKKK
ncbi:MAG: carboxypeptidase-like regulatory domain-containing protein [Chlorobi bacterium]|nr:carboxypeptidase-like regulatory domain-containing protein [Chlorobiota bacterium]